MKIENSLLQVGIDHQKGTIQVLDKRTQKLWKGDSLLKAIYKDGYDCPVDINIAKDASWKIISKTENNKIEINYYHPNIEITLGLKIELKEDVIKVTIPDSKIKEGKSISWTKGNPSKLAQISLLPQFGAAKEGEEGYLVLPQQSGIVCEFKNKVASEYEIGIYSGNSGFRKCNMPIFGHKINNSAFVGIIEGGCCDAVLKLGTNQWKEHHYYIYPLFNLRYNRNDERLPEDISVEYHFLKNDEASYVGMAKRYREHVIKRRKVKPLKGRTKNNSALNYATKCLEVRIRHGWKPAPPQILEQTPENEPDMKVACTFEKAGEIIEEFKRQGIDKAEFCLVGWHCKGHDGRFPQLFPVEEKLGGENKLKALIKKTQDMGYQIVAHDIYHDAFSIAEDWHEEYLLKADKGGIYKYGKFSGGQSYIICAKRAYELFAKRDLPRIRELGFKGLHYTDVLSILGLERCYDPAHPVNNRECAEWRNKILKLSQELFGGVHSEGPLDFAIPFLDRVLYVEEITETLEKKNYVDRIIPLWEIVYHGTVVYSLSCRSVNALKGEKAYLRSIEYGAMPLIYFYGHFVSKSEDNWLGDRDFCYNDRETLKKDISKIKEVYDELIGKLSYLQAEFIEDHQKLDEGVYKTVYSDGSEVIVNYGKEAYKAGGEIVPGHSYLLIKAARK